MVNSIKSPYLGCLIGVPRGSILESILLFLYINNLPSFKDINVQMCTDDAFILNPSSNRPVIGQTNPKARQKGKSNKQTDPTPEILHKQRDWNACNKTKTYWHREERAHLLNTLIIRMRHVYYPIFDVYCIFVSQTFYGIC